MVLKSLVHFFFQKINQICFIFFNEIMAVLKSLEPLAVTKHTVPL